MRRLRRIGGLLDCFSFSLCGASSCGCLCRTRAPAEEEDDEVAAIERKALVSSSSNSTISSSGLQVMRLRDFVDGNYRTSSAAAASRSTLGFHLQPKTVELRVSMHCNGCARKVHKHISKMEGVTWFEVDLERKKVVVTGDVTPLEVLQSVSKVVKLAQLWMAPN